MKSIFEYIDSKNWEAPVKCRAALWLAAAAGAAAGLVVWLLLRTWILPTVDWMLCFIGYPMLISWVVIFIYLCNHPFSDGR